MITPDEKYFESPISNPRFIKKNYPEFFEYLESQYSNLTNISEKIYWWRFGLTSVPKCDCGADLKFMGIKKGYARFCSVKCSRNSLVTKAKAAQTCIERYGVDNPRKSEIIKTKAAQTCIERYGVDNPSKSPDVIKRINATSMKKYGTQWIGQSAPVKEKIKQTCTERYGVGSGIETEFARIRRREANLELMTDRYAEIVDVDHSEYICSCPHPNCNKCAERTYKVPVQVFFDRRRDKTEPCTHLLPIKSPNKISGLEIQVQLILDELNLEYQVQRNDLIDGRLQLDIYIPKHNIAIEVNGCYNHSIHHHAKDFEPDRQYKKYISCQEHGIRLISIWEDWLKNKPDIVRSLLRSKFGRYDTRIGARQCKVAPIKTKVAREFVDANHIQGYSRSKYKYGLFYKDELVAVMTFSEPNRLQGGTNGGWVLNRFCSKLNTQIIGGANKLLAHFIREVSPSKITSYSSNDISDGLLYKKLGFVSDGINSRCYWYIKPGTLQRWHRTYFNKSRQYACGLRKINDKRTEIQAMLDAGYMVCYDTYLKTWVLNLH